ncbi:MAG: polysaccharide deacetylase family protein [Candidatus Acididesulfobacter guangdongensis]|uniref:Polysaccharide deacetylase family protein n=1 Tax=Acididesulfobacter guangdongensis TaxID=2597225 RepID=A0A519BF26_ACIG2|nr:MAG: polysaccharide deacetylase family protein [Candidatus Acididesulfobacter guangdongensis]
MKIPVLYYHKIDYPKSTAILKGLYVKPEQFKLQMKVLKILGYRTITPYELLLFTKGHRLPFKKPILITFDDGYKNNYTYAYPILKAFGFTATVFISSGCIGKTNAIMEKNGKENQAEDFLDKKNIIEMSKNGITIASHGINHYFLNELTDDGVLAGELLASKAILEDLTGKKIDFFSYPYGAYNAKVMRETKNAGYKGAFTTNKGKIAVGDNSYELKRISVNGHNTIFNFLYKIIFMY